jgi:hypothetical protein
MAVDGTWRQATGVGINFRAFVAVWGGWTVLRRVSNVWKNAQREWTAVMTQFAIMFGDRFSVE